MLIITIHILIIITTHIHIIATQIFIIIMTHILIIMTHEPMTIMKGHVNFAKVFYILFSLNYSHFSITL